MSASKLAAAISEVITNTRMSCAVEVLGKEMSETNGTDKAYSYFLRDLRLAREVVEVRHSTHIRSQGSPYMQNIVENQRKEIETLTKELEDKTARIQELEKVLLQGNEKEDK